MLRLGSIEYGTSGSEVRTAAIQGLSYQRGESMVNLRSAAVSLAQFNAVLKISPRVSVTVRTVDYLEELKCEPFMMHFREVDSCGKPKSPDAWVSLAAASTTLVPQRISALAVGVATLSLNVLVKSSDGETDPWVVGTTAGITTAEAHTWRLKGSNLRRAEIDHGFRVAPVSEATRYVENNFITSQDPSISVVTNDEADMTTALMNTGTAGAPMSAVLQKVEAGGVEPSSGSGRTITYSVTGHKKVGTITAQNGQPVGVGPMVQGNTSLTITPAA